MVMTEKIMPSNIEIEKCVIGSMFLSDQACKKCIENPANRLIMHKTKAETPKIV